MQLLHKASVVIGARSDFDLLRILSHQLEKQGIGKAFHYKHTAGVYEEIRKAVPGYAVELSGLLSGAAVASQVAVKQNGHAAYDVPVGLIRPAQDSLFTSGTLGRYLQAIESVPEAQAKS